MFFGSIALATEEGIDAQSLSELASFVRWGGVFISMFAVIGAMLLLRLLTTTVETLGARFAKRRLTLQKFESMARFLIYAVTAMLVLGLSFQWNNQTITIILGLFGIGLGWSLKDFVSPIIAGVLIMFDRPFQVGDRVAYAGEYGDVIKIGLRSVRLRTLDDNIVTIPNIKLLTDVTSSGNYGALDMQVVVDFYVGADQDVDTAERLVREAMLTSRYVFLKRPVVVLISQEIVADMVVVQLRAKGYVLDTKYEKAFETDVSKRVLGAFRRYGVLPPAAFERAPRFDGSEASA
jgi:small-conductance mechanosensitive channel